MKEVALVGDDELRAAIEIDLHLGDVVCFRTLAAHRRRYRRSMRCG